MQFHVGHEIRQFHLLSVLYHLKDTPFSTTELRTLRKLAIDNSYQLLNPQTNLILHEYNLSTYNSH